MHLKLAQQLLALVLINQLASAVFAQDDSQNNDSASGEPADKGMLSLTRVEPDLTPISDYSGDFSNRFGEKDPLIFRIDNRQRPNIGLASTSNL